MRVRPIECGASEGKLVRIVGRTVCEATEVNVGKVVVPLAVVALGALIWAVWPVSESDVDEPAVVAAALDDPGKAGKTNQEGDRGGGRRAAKQSRRSDREPGDDEVTPVSNAAKARAARAKRSTRSRRRMGPVGRRARPRGLHGRGGPLDVNMQPIGHPKLDGPAGTSDGPRVGAGAPPLAGMRGGTEPSRKTHPATEFPAFPIEPMQSSVQDYVDTLPSSGAIPTEVQVADVLPAQMVRDLGLNPADQLIDLGDFPVDQRDTYREALNKQVDETSGEAHMGITVKGSDGAHDRIYFTLHR